MEITTDSKVALSAWIDQDIETDRAAAPAMSCSLPQCPDKTPSMNVEAVLHMKAGVGESSYAQNSSHQKKSTETLRSVVIESAKRVHEALRPETFTAADLGCASGNNALGLAEAIIRSIVDACSSSGSSPAPEFSVLLNDLPTNDFNTVFSRAAEVVGRLKADGKASEVFLSGVPGSFYGRLFPSGSVHLVCSFTSLHWLSQVPDGLRDETTNAPLNKGRMFVSSTSPPAVPAAYGRQFRKDLSLFLRSRAAEVVAGGRMVLSMLSREAEDCREDVQATLLWDLLSESLAALVSQGVLEQEKVDAYDAPFYAPSAREIEEEVSREGSFSLDHVQTYETNLNSGGGDASRAARTVAMAIRAIQESMLTHHFGPDIIDALFHKYTELLTDSMTKGEVKSVQIGVVLVRM